jgi:MinD-like ATPase involved in chromosome partitioning or flagellar assembly
MAVPVPVLTATCGADWEARLVGGWANGAQGLVVVRRCVDTVELLAVAASGQGRAALVGAELRRLDGEAVATLLAAGVAPVGVITPGDVAAEQRLRALGIAVVVTTATDPDEAAAAVLTGIRELAAAGGGAAAGAPGAAAGAGPGQRWAFAGLGGSPVRPVEPTPVSTPRGAPVSGGELGSGSRSGSRREPGQLIAVWGPTGAPGRTTLAATLGAELAALGRSTMLVDADVYGGVLAAHLGILDEAPGLAAAARAANAGTLDAPTLVGHTLQVLPGLTVLTGIARADRWPEIRPAALATVWRLARDVADFVVVDCGFCLEVDEELSFDSVAPRRNGATLAVLEAADRVLAVAAADPVGLQRLVRSLDELRELVPSAVVDVVVNRLRRGSVGADPEGQVSAALTRFAGVRPLAFLPDDRVACDAALLRGRTVTEAAPDSRLHREVAGLARQLAAVPTGRTAGRPTGRRRAG